MRSSLVRSVNVQEVSSLCCAWRSWSWSELEEEEWSGVVRPRGLRVSLLDSA